MVATDTLPFFLINFSLALSSYPRIPSAPCVVASSNTESFPSKTFDRQVPLNLDSSHATNSSRDVYISSKRLQVAKTSEHYSGKYDEAWKSQYPRGSCFGCRFYGKLPHPKRAHARYQWRKVGTRLHMSSLVCLEMAYPCPWL